MQTLKMCHHLDKWDFAIDLLDTMKISHGRRVLINASDLVARTLLKCDKKSEAIKVLRDTSKLGLKRHGKIIDYMIQACDLEGALSVFKHAHKLRRKLAYESYLAMGHACVQSSKEYLLDDLMNDMIFQWDGSSEVCAQCIQLFRDVGLFDRSRLFFMRLITSGVDPSMYTMKSLLGLNAMGIRTENCDHVLEHIRYLEKMGELKYLETLFCAVNIFCDSLNFEYAFKLFRENAYEAFLNSFEQSIHGHEMSTKRDVIDINIYSGSCSRVLWIRCVNDLYFMSNRVNQLQVVEKWVEKSFTSTSKLMIRHHKKLLRSRHFYKKVFAKGMQRWKKSPYDLLKNPPAQRSHSSISEAIPLDVHQYNLGIDMNENTQELLLLMKQRGVSPSKKTYELLTKIMQKEELFKLLRTTIRDLELSTSSILHKSDMNDKTNDMIPVGVTTFLREGCRSVIKELSLLSNDIRSFESDVSVGELQGIPVPNHIRYLYLLDFALDILDAQNLITMMPKVDDIEEVLEYLRLASAFSDSRVYVGKAVCLIKCAFDLDIHVSSDVMFRMFERMHECISYSTSINDMSLTSNLYESVRDLFSDLPEHYYRCILSSSNIAMIMEAYNSEIYSSCGTIIDAFESFLLHCNVRVDCLTVDSDPWKTYFRASYRACSVQNDHLRDKTYALLRSSRMASLFIDDDFCCRMIELAQETSVVDGREVLIVLLESIVNSRDGNLDSSRNRLCAKVEIALTFLEETCFDDEFADRLISLRAALPY